METREFRDMDELAVRKIYREAFAGFPWFENLAESEIKRRWEKIKAAQGFGCLVAIEADQVIGLICWDTPSIDDLSRERGLSLAKFAESNVPEGALLVWERELAVTPKHQRKGAGTRLRIAFLINTAKKDKPVFILSRMRDDNLPTIKIAEELGYTRTGIKMPSSQKPGVFHEYWYILL